MPSREPINDEVEVLFIGKIFCVINVSSIERAWAGEYSYREYGSDVGGTYWNRYPGAACDVVSYDYLPLLDEAGLACRGRNQYHALQKFFSHRQAIAQYNLYDLAVFTILKIHPLG